MFAFVAALLALKQQTSVDDAMLADCLRLYENYGLPLPPKDARLAVNTRLATKRTAFVFIEGSPSSSYGRVLAATQIQTISLRNFTQRPLTSQLIDSLDTQASTKPWKENNGIAGAMVLYSQGHRELAARLLQRGLADQALYDWDVGYIPPNTPARTAIAYLALAHYENELAQPESDQSSILKGLTAVFSAEKDAGIQAKKPLLDDLRAALDSPPAPKGSPESIIDGLMDCNEKFTFYYFNPYTGTHGKGVDRRLEEAIERGPSLGPLLLEHFDDPRLTRSFHDKPDGGSTGAPIRPRLYTVGDICQAILCGLCTEPFDLGLPSNKDNVQRWLSKLPPKISNEQYAFNLLVDSTTSRLEGPVAYCLLNECDPARFADVVRERTKRGMPTRIECLMLRRSNAPLPLKRRVAEELAQGRESYYVKSGLDLLYELDRSRFDVDLFRALKNFDTLKSNKLYGGSLGDLADEVSLSRSDSVWQEYSDLLKRTSLDNRCLLLEHTVTDAKPFFLIARRYFDDETPVPQDVQEYLRNYGPYDQPLETVGQIALFQVARSLWDESGPYATSSADWAALRARVDAALKSQP